MGIYTMSRLSLKIVSGNYFWLNCMHIVVHFVEVLLHGDTRNTVIPRLGTRFVLHDIVCHISDQSTEEKKI